MAVKRDDTNKTWFFYGCTYDNGERKQFKRRGFKTKKEAVLAEAQYLEELKNKKTRVLFSDMVNSYFEYAKGRYKESTYNADSYSMEKWLEEFGDRWIDTITKEDLQNFIDKMDSMYSKKYVEKIYYAMNKIFNFAVKREMIDKNLMILVERNPRPNEFKKEMQFWEPEEFDQFISVVEDPMWRTFFSTMFYMGIRRGECMALTWKDIDLEKKSMTINKTTSSRLRAQKIKYTPPKTKNSFRTITMPDVLVNEMKHWYLIEKNNGFSDLDEAFVFGNQLPLPQETIRRRFNEYIERANVKRIRLHDLRHSHASYLINNMNAGFTDFDIAKRLGDTVETLHDTYAHWFRTKDEKIIDFMNEDNKKTAISPDKLMQLGTLLKELGLN